MAGKIENDSGAILETWLEAIKTHRGGASFEYQKGPRRIVKIIDDWAWRKGQDYGTILVNLDLHRVIDLLPERSAESFSAWLKWHPEIVIIARDRSGIVADFMLKVRCAGRRKRSR